MSIKPEGKVGSLSVGGQVCTSGDDVVSLEIEGEVGKITVGGGICATGKGSDAVHLVGEASILDGIELTAEHGESLVQTI